MTGASSSAPAPIDKMADCPALAALVPIAGKWKTRVLWHLRGGGSGFGDLRRALRGPSAKVLSETLTQLESDGLISRTTGRDGAVAITRYTFTEHGRSLIPVLDALGEWGIAHRLRQLASSPDHCARASGD